jgi:hypothetical protein
LTELADIHSDTSEADEPALVIAVMSTMLTPLPNTVIILEPVEIIPSRTLETMGEFNETETFERAGDDNRDTVNNTGASLIEPNDTFTVKELSEAQALDSPELIDNLTTTDELKIPKSRPDKVKNTAPENGELPETDKGTG